MKFKKTGSSGSGGNMGDYIKNDSADGELNCSTTCTGETRKGDDVYETDPLDLVVKWEYLIHNKNEIKYDFYYLEHYRIYDREIPVTDKDIIPVIKETFKVLNEHFKERNEKSRTLIPIQPLDSEKIQYIVEGLKKSLQKKQEL